jgi:EmrB/QacA subfamily drug resistance transporter
MSTTTPRLTRGDVLVLVVLLAAQFMFALDFSIVTVALPVIGAELNMGPGALTWIVTLFALSAAGLMLLMGRIGDYYGRKRLFLIGMALLTGGSLVGGLANSAEVIYLARVLQGVATAITTPSALALLTTSFREGPARNRALGLNGALLSLGFAAGSVLGGVLTELFGWRFTFLINVPVGLAVLAVAPFVIRNSSEPSRQRLDVPGAVTLTGALLTLVLGLARAEEHGWAAGTTLALLAGAAVLAVAFWVIESRSPHPLAAVTILRRRSVALGNLGGLATFSMESGKVFLLTIYLQQVLGASALQTGIAFTVLGAGAFTGGLVAARVINRVGARATMVGGLLTQAVTVLTFLALGHDFGFGYGLILVMTAIGGFGHVLVIVSYTVAVTSGLPDSEQGLATGLTAMTQQVAFTLGTPVLAAVAIGAGVSAVASAGEKLAGVQAGLVVSGVVLLVVAGLVAALYRGPLPTPPKGGGSSARDLRRVGSATEAGR